MLNAWVFSFIILVGGNMHVPNNVVNTFTMHTNLRVYRSGFSIADIFRDYWDAFLVAYPHLVIRDVVFDNVARMLKCRTPELGFSHYECPHCDNFLVAFNTCKSRFCNSCGSKYSKARGLAVSRNLIDCHHRHITFTIPDSLRHYFQKKRERLNYLFEAVNMTIAHLLKKHGRHKDYKTGFICVLHTFGRALNFNPHIHVLISEGMVDVFGNVKPLKFFSFELLRKSFMKCLLDLLHQDLGPSFYLEKTELYRLHKKGFYVHAPESSNRFKSQSDLVKYVLRYTGRPVMAESRIIEIDHVRQYIRYFYEPHEDDHLPEEARTGAIEVYEPISEFIKKLIVHIPEYQFKTIRYYGLYSSKGKKRLPNYRKKFTYLRHKTGLKWRALLKESFDYDVLLCSCGSVMHYIKEASYYP